MVRVLLTALAAALIVAPSASAFDPAYEAANYGKINERAETDYTPEFNVQLAQQSATNEAAAASIVASDGALTGHKYGRDFSGNLCGHPGNGCAGDIRLYQWGEKGFGVVQPVLFTARNGSTLSGHVWMTKAGPTHRPAVVITNGSVQAPETLYWFAAQTLAKAGYVVLTWDPQGQGYSDTYGEGADRNDGFPSQTGRPFYDGTEDALDFFFSTPADPYVPRKSCTSGTSHADKQAARVGDGRSSAFNPFFASIDTNHVGLVGHSLGAAAVSYIGQLDPRVQAIVAYDNLSDVSDPEGATFGGQTLECTSNPGSRPQTLPITKPALGMSADYGLTPTPYTADPSEQAIHDKLAGSLATTKAGVDTGELMIRGGTHYEFSYIPNPGFGATRRGIDLVDWYTLAWMDKELKGDATADARLLTTRWHDDRLEREVDGQNPPDGNLFSTYIPSRLDIDVAGGHFDCEDLRKQCTGMAPDSLPPDFSFLAAAQTPDSAATGGTSTAPAGSTGTPPAATGPKALDTIAKAGGCAPRSRITRVRRHRHVLRIRGRAHGVLLCRKPVTRVTLIIKRKGGKARRIRAHGAGRWRVRVKLRRGRYVLRSRAVARGGIRERRRGRGRRITVHS
ncbi:MAG: hypothetical protein QOI80_2917 [Solirubrobacteraceae bacterium]|nr:hypothetical protein [Solirubrobacteraceae bacterium]